MADLLPTPQPRDRRLLLQLRQTDLPRVHDADPGRDALPRVREPADQSHPRNSHGSQSRALSGDLRPGRDQRRDFLAEIASGAGGLENDQHLADPRLRPLRPLGRRRRVVPAASPPASSTPASSTSLGNMLLLFFLGRILEPGIGTARFLADLLRLALRRLAWGADLDPGLAHGRCLGSRLRDPRRDLRDRPRQGRRRARLLGSGS